MSNAVTATPPRELADPLIGEARERQRKRRLWGAWIVTLAAAAAAALFWTSHQWGLPIASWHTTTADVIKRDALSTVRTFDTALATGDYAAACSLLNPVAGQGVLRRVTNAVGIHGSCQTRLGAVARIVGARRLKELTRARISDIQYGGTPNQFGAQLWFNQEDTSWAGDVPSVGLGRDAANTPVTIQCAPLICGGTDVLRNYIDEDRLVK